MVIGRTLIVEGDHVLLPGAVVEDDEGAASPLGLDPVGEQRVRPRQLAGFGQRDSKLEREVPPGGVVLGQQRHGPLQQADRRQDVAACQGPRSGRPRRPAARVGQLASPLIDGASSAR